MLHCAVTHDPRRPQYLRQTLASLYVSGFGTPLIVADAAPRLGIVPTFRRALQLVHSTADYCAIIQDDVDVSPGFGPYGQVPRHPLLENLPAPRGVFSLYLSEGRSAPPGWSELPNSPADGYPDRVGACGYLIDRETAARLLDSPPFARTDRLGAQLALWCRQECVPYWLHSPSLLTHLGDVRCRDIRCDSRIPATQGGSYGSYGSHGRAAELAAAVPHP